MTNEDGRYRIIELAPGTYKVKATHKASARKSKSTLITVAGQNVQLDFSLAPAGVQAEQTVTIGGDDAPLVDTTRTIVGGTITEREVEELPNNTRNPLDLVLTLAERIRRIALNERFGGRQKRQSENDADRTGKFFALGRRVLLKQHYDRRFG